MTAALRLSALLTHPVQYYSPLFRELAQGCDLTVYYAHRPSPTEQGEGFGVPFVWDIDLTDGYRHIWLANQATTPDVNKFRGCDTPSIARHIEASRPDAFLVFGWHSLAYWQAIRACRRTGIPVIVRGDSQLGTPRGGVRRLAKQFLYPIMIRQFAACVSVGTRSEAYFRAYGARAIYWSPHFVDNEFFACRATAELRAASRDRWSIPNDALVVLFAGKLTPMKRPLDAVAAVAATNRTDVHLLVAGAGVLEPEMRAAAAAAAVKASFAGFLNQTELPAAYAAADVLVLPSTGQETWGLVVNEAMACGRPAIVSSSVGSTPDLIVENVTGYAEVEGDITSMSARIASLAADRAGAAIMGRAARAHIARYNSTNAARGVMAAAYDAARARGTKPS